MSLDPIIDDLQGLNPSAIIELFELELDSALHGSQTTMTYRFHSGSNVNANGEIVWRGNTYLRYPVEASGFAFQKGQLPRPQITISNTLSLLTAVMLEVNKVTAGNDLTGSKVTRIRTLAKFIDAANFSGGSNPYGTPANNEFPREIYYIDRKAAENRDIVSFELASISDMAGIRVPKRQCTRALFPAIGTFV